MLVSAHSHGQRHETIFAQVVAGELEVALAGVKVSEGNTATLPYGWGAWGSRGVVTADEVVTLAMRKVRNQRLCVAPCVNETPLDDLELIDGLM
jgi:carbon-monoxide dehydrogenase large subunit